MATPVTRAEVIALLDKFDEVSDAPFNMRLTRDDQQARQFLNDDLDTIRAHWTGTPDDLAVLTRFLLGK